jgi:hypothetical protein
MPQHVAAHCCFGLCGKMKRQEGWHGVSSDTTHAQLCPPYRSPPLPPRGWLLSPKAEVCSVLWSLVFQGDSGYDKVARCPVQLPSAKSAPLIAGYSRAPNPRKAHATSLNDCAGLLLLVDAPTRHFQRRQAI